MLPKDLLRVASVITPRSQPTGVPYPTLSYTPSLATSQIPTSVQVFWPSHLLTLCTSLPYLTILYDETQSTPLQDILYTSNAPVALVFLVTHIQPI